MKDAIVGAITRYSPQQIEPWVKSIEKCGFKGDKYMLVYEVPQETIQFLSNNGFNIFDCGSLGNMRIVVRRFLDIYSLLISNDFNYGRVIVTDVKDVFFQLNPTEWLDKNLTKPILVGSESILCKDMEWSRRNYSNSYPIEWPRIENELSYCAGVIAGETKTIADLFLAIFRWSLTGSSQMEPPDQAALNVLISMEPFKRHVQKVSHKDGWVTHLGVSLDKPEEFGPYLKDTLPKVKENLVVNSENIPFVISHQHDRLPDIEKSLISTLNN